MRKHSKKTLHTAASQGNLELVQGLIADGESVDRLDFDGFTALYRAAANGYPKVVQYLLESGADPDGLTSSDASNSATTDSESSTVEQSDEEEEDEGTEKGQRGIPLLKALHHQNRTAAAEVVRLLLSAGEVF